MLQAFGGSHDAAEPVDNWMLDWLAQAARSLVGQAPRVAAELLARAVADSPADSAQRGVLESLLSDALYRTGDRMGAERVASRALEHAVEPDVLVDLHWTLAQCRLRAGSVQESLATLDQALAAPGISPRHRARLLVLVARTHDNVGEVERAGQAATKALTAATAAGDTWATGWALHVLTLVTASQGHMHEALALWDRALNVTESDPLLTDLRLLLQINHAIALGCLDRYEEALSAAEQVRDLADQIGTAVRLGQAHSAHGQLLFDMGRWDEALAELLLVHQSLKEPGVACTDLGVAAVIRFHRGEIGAARRHLAGSVQAKEDIGLHRLIASLALARSLDREQDGALPEALAVLTDALDGNPEELDEIEILLADTVRLASQTGDLSTAQAVARSAAEHAAGWDIPHRQGDALYCRGLVNHDASLLLEAAERYGDASRPLRRAKALEAAAREFVSADATQARAAFTRAVDIYANLGAAADVTRIQAEFRAYGIRRGPHAKHRQADSGWDSLTATELQVAALVEEGLSNPEIAARLVLSPRTVGTHVSHILKKLDIHSRTDIARESVLRTTTPR
jgi:DNA-binding CsgD family transcriptional regulator